MTESAPTTAAPKSRMAYILLAFFLGSLGSITSIPVTRSMALSSSA